MYICLIQIIAEFDHKCGKYGLSLNLLTTTIFAPPSNASKWQMGFNSAFKGLIYASKHGFYSADFHETHHRS